MTADEAREIVKAVYAEAQVFGLDGFCICRSLSGRWVTISSSCRTSDAAWISAAKRIMKAKGDGT